MEYVWEVNYELQASKVNNIKWKLHDKYLACPPVESAQKEKSIVSVICCIIFYSLMSWLLSRADWWLMEYKEMRSTTMGPSLSLLQSEYPMDLGHRLVDATQNRNHSQEASM